MHEFVINVTKFRRVIITVWPEVSSKFRGGRGMPRGGPEKMFGALCAPILGPPEKKFNSPLVQVKISET